LFIKDIDKFFLNYLELYGHISGCGGALCGVEVHFVVWAHFWDVEAFGMWRHTLGCGGTLYRMWRHIRM
jgi:hypothetical protein